MRALLIGLVIVLAATSAWLWRELNQERQERENLEIQVAQQGDPRLVRNAQSDAAVESSPAARPRQAALEEAQQSGISAIETRIFDPRSNPRLRQDSNYLEARERFYEAMLNDEYPDLARVLRVSEKTATRLIELRAEQRVRKFGAGLPTGDETNQSLFKLEKQQREYEADVEIAALIGQAKLQEWKDYEGSVPERQQVKRLRLELMDSSDPLEFEDGEPLIRALYEVRLQVQQEFNAMIVDTPSGDEDHPSAEALGEKLMRSNEDSNRRMLNASEELLSPSQLKIFRRMLETQQEFENAMTLMHRAQREALN